MTQATPRIGLALAVIGVALLGNLRSEASESTVPPRGPTVTTPLQSVAMSQADEDDASAAAPGALEETEEAELVPALYARDPDVRFVYFRRISKWM